jgi:hypothetical protein
MNAGKEDVKPITVKIKIHNSFANHPVYIRISRGGLSSANDHFFHVPYREEKQWRRMPGSEVDIEFSRENGANGVYAHRRGWVPPSDVKYVYQGGNTLEPYKKGGDTES